MQSQKNLEKDKTRIYNDKISVEGQLEKKQIELKQCRQVGNVLINKFSLRPSCWLPIPDPIPRIGVRMRNATQTLFYRKYSAHV